MALFELYWGNVASRSMTALWVVEHLDVVEDIASGLIPGGIDLASNALTLEQLEEALCHSVVVAVAATTHAGDQIVIAQEALPVVAGELTTLV